MNKEEFKKLVIAEAQKYLFSNENEIPSDGLKTIKENTANKATIVETDKQSITPSQIKTLAEEMKKISKVIDLRNPLISESDESLVESILKKSTDSKRTLDVDSINKSKHLSFQNEAEKNKWERMLNYRVPTDENRTK